MSDTKPLPGLRIDPSPLDARVSAPTTTMDSSEAQAADIYTGLWINWSRGAVFGGTLTLPRADANNLIAFVAFFIAWGLLARHLNSLMI